LDVQESEGERSGGKKVIERTEAVRHILAIMKKLGGSLAADTEATSWMEGQPMITYHELREISPQKARELIRKVLAKQEGDVSKTARILNISRPTVRRARDGDLEDRSRRPLHSPAKTASHFEELIVQEGKRTGFRYRRLAGYLQKKFSIRFSEDTVKAVLRRNGVKQKTRKTANARRRPLYDYEALMPFQEMQLDTKHLLENALLAEVYAHIKHYQLPLYEWNIIDVATRIRFTAYSHELVLYLA
jgi:putative transposase